MIRKLSLAILSVLLFPSIVMAETAVESNSAEPISVKSTSIEEGKIKQAAEKSEKNAEDELLKLEQTVGESPEDSAAVVDTEKANTEKAFIASDSNTNTEKAAEDAASANPWQPAAKKFDWVQLTSGEWLKGEIKSMYNDSLEFDSDKLDLLDIDWEDVKYLKSYRSSSINLENHEPVSGSLQITGDQITITAVDGVHEFNRAELISLTPSGKRERDLWAIKFTLGLNVRSGNTNQIDYNSKFNAKRRTAKSRFVLDYIGNISKTDDTNGNFVETVNNNRFSASHNIYATRYFFYTPIFAEYYRDPLQNLDQRITAGIGLGYTIFDTGLYEWNVNGGPAYVSNKYISVQPGEEQTVKAPAVALGTDFNAELTSTLDFIFKYSLLATRKDSGGYTHHMIGTFESEISGSLDFDISMIWDRISQPATDQNGVTPAADDYRLTLGVTYTY